MPVDTSAALARRGRHARGALTAAFLREITAQRLSRFLHVHLVLALAAGSLPLLTPADAAGAAPWWVLQAVLYCLSLSAMLLGLSSAHGEADEFALLFSQPAPRWAWLLGKAAGLAVLLLPAALLLVVPAALAGGITRPLVTLAVAAAGVSLALAAVGLGLGFWVRDGVRGLLATLAAWFVLLFGTDLLLLALAGAPWLHANPSAWVLPLMLNPLDALRVTVLFAIEQTATTGMDAGLLATWWIEHAGLWLGVLLTAWCLGGLAASLAGARRSLDS
jgi:Cu-processing system permease protein